MENTSEDWRGCSMEEIYRNLSPFELKHFKSVRPSDNHTVLYHFPIKQFDCPPKPLKGHSKWDAYHVRLPCSTKSLYPVTNLCASSIESRWEMIEKALLRPIKNSHELELAVLSYNSKYENIWNFQTLHNFFSEMDEDETNIFFDELLPKIIQLALRLPELIATAIPLLKQNDNKSITLSQQQISCLLANAFLCTYPRRNTMKRKSEYSTFPDINFNRLFQTTGSQTIEKLKCIFHYFRRVCNKTPLGVVTFTRRSIRLHDLPNWSSCEAPLGITPLHISSVGTIEDQGIGLLQVDFANKFIGGGVLGSGCVQEEIRFVICPELIISKLFTEALRPNESLIMIGAEQYSEYTGYASTFTWNGNFNDKTPFDESHRKQCHIVAIDALLFIKSEHQYREELMLRELNKAYVGFFHSLDSPAPGIASGNWGCGAFGGSARLKALIQLMACTITKRPLVYFTFGDEELRDEIHKIHTFFIEENVKLNELWNYLKQFEEKKLEAKKLYEFIIKSHLKRNDRIGKEVKKIIPEETRGTPECSTSANRLSNNSTTLMCPNNLKRLRSPDSSENLAGKIIDLDEHLLDELNKDDDSLIPMKVNNDDKETDQSPEFNESKDLFDFSSSPDCREQIRIDEDTTKGVKKIKTSTNMKLTNFFPVQRKINSITSTTTAVEAEKTEAPKKTSLIDMLDFCYDKK